MKNYVVTPTLICAGLFSCLINFESAIAQENTLDQVTSVSQLSDVQPTDWAFQAYSL